MAATNSPNRYTDDDLNVADKEFNDIVNRPDMQALDEQGDAAIRDHDAKAGDSKPDGKNVGDLGRAESKAASGPRNNFYNPTRSGGATKGSSGFVGSLKGAFTGKNKKRNIALGGGIGGGAIGITLLIFSLLPFKLPGLMEIIANEAGQRVEQITERRAKQIIARAILTRMGIKAGGGYIVTGNGPLHDLYASMRTAGFEKKLAAKGITIQDRGANGVRVLLNGEVLGRGDLRTDREIIEALDGNRVTNQVLKQLVKEEVPSWRWMKRAKFAKWLRLKYGIPRYGIENSQNDDDDEKVAEMQKGRLKTSYERITKNVMEVFGCVMGGDSCPANQSADRPDDGRSSDNAIDESDLTETADELLEEETSNRKFFAKVHAKLLDTVLGKLASKAIPIIGWIDLAATVDHIIYEFGDNDYLATLPAYYRGLGYAQIYGERAGYADQQKLGALDPAFIAVLATQADGAEESQAFNYINGDSTRGKPIDMKVNNCDDCKSSINRYWQWYKDNIGDTLAGSTGTIKCPDDGIGAGACITSHEIMNAYYETIGGGGLLGWLSGVVGDAGSWAFQRIMDLLPGLPFEDWLANKMKQAMKFVLETFGLYIDPLDTGAALFNNMHAGATVTFNSFCEESGCRKLTPEQTGMVNSQIAAERDEYLRSQSLGYRLFSPENTRSITTQLAVSLPTAPQNDITGSVSAFASLVANAPAKLLSTVLPTASANTKYVDLYGVDPFGALPADLNQNISNELLRGEECPDVAENQYNGCKIDKTVAEAMICEFTPEIPDCSDEDAPVEGSAGFVVGSYNVLDSDAHEEDSRRIGGCSQAELANDRNCTRTRSARQAQIINGNSSAGNPAFDVVGTQEMSETQYNQLKSMLSGYDAFPTDGSGLGNSRDGKLGIFWKRSKFTLVESGKAPGLSNIADRINNPWVGLRATNGQMVYFMSIHYAHRDCSDGRCDGNKAPNNVFEANMRESSRLTMDWVRSKATGNNIAIVVGDYNDQLRWGLSYCVYTQGGLMQHAHDMAQGDSPSAGCSRPDTGGIDHIYVTPKENVTATGWTHMSKSGIVARASDHSPVYATVNLGGDEEAAGGSFQWPIKRADFTHLSGCYPRQNGSSGNGHAGIDIDVPNTGYHQRSTPVYSATTGTVTAVDDDIGGGISGVQISAPGGMYVVYEHMTGYRSFVRVGERVNAGDQIGFASDVGATGAHHLHFGVTTQRGWFGVKSNPTDRTKNPLDFLPADRPLANALGGTCTASGGAN